MSPQLLPYELLLAQVEALDICLSLFPLSNELVLDPASSSLLPHLRSYLDTSATGAPPSQLSGTASLDFKITLAIDPSPPYTRDPTRTFPLSLSVSLPLTLATALLTLHQPPWLSRASHATLASRLPKEGSSTELVMEAVELLRDEAGAMVPPEEKEEVEQEKEQEWRVWFHFPSLSTREKRDDIVNWAPDYHLTGFVLAGKPAMLCLEGTEANVQSYVAEIKSRSWADIPSFQKKISERYRSQLSETEPRIFTDMQEITALIDRGGHRGNRGDMGQVEDYLKGKGLGEAFGIVIGGGQFV